MLGFMAGIDARVEEQEAMYEELDNFDHKLGLYEDYALLDDRSELDPSGELRVPAVIDLVDGRRVVLEELEVAPGELGLRFRTAGP